MHIYHSNYKLSFSNPYIFAEEEGRRRKERGGLGEGRRRKERGGLREGTRRKRLGGGERRRRCWEKEMMEK